jgi:N6-adenosine-specific RNA methylase IME4
MVLYKTVLADPPWPERGGGKIKRGADRHYGLMSVDDIILTMEAVLGGRVSPVGCHLYLWVTNNYLPAGLNVVEALGFRYVTTITWVKDKMGLGQYFRGMSEHCLFGVQGSLPYRVRPNGKRAQGVTAFLEPRASHSQKPDGIFAMAEQVSWPPRLEMFARQKRVGWDCWGDEVEADFT